MYHAFSSQVCHDREERIESAATLKKQPPENWRRTRK
jgi:hypothetical protein